MDRSDRVQYLYREEARIVRTHARTSACPRPWLPCPYPLYLWGEGNAYIF